MTLGHAGPRRRTGRAVALMLALMLAMALAASGCAGPVRTTAVATPQPDTPAYELAGPTLAQLRAEAARRCPQGFQVLRSAETGERRGGPDDGVVTRWLARGADVLAPPRQSAQLLVLCQPTQGSAAGATQGAAHSAGNAADAAPRGMGGPGGQAEATTSRRAATLPALAGIDLPPPSQAPVTGYD